MEAEQAGKSQVIHPSSLFRTFEYIARKSWINFALIAIFLNLVPNIFIGWITIDPALRTDGPSLPYFVGKCVDLACSSAFSVLIARECLAEAGVIKGSRVLTFLVYIRFFTFSLFVNIFVLFELSISVMDKTMAHALAHFIPVPNVSLRALAVAFFGLFLPTLFEGTSFMTGLSKSFKYESGMRTAFVAFYAVFCALDFAPLPALQLSGFARTLNFSSDKYNLMAVDAAAKAISAIFETTWIIGVTSFYLIRRNRGFGPQVIANSFN